MALAGIAACTSSSRMHSGPPIDANDLPAGEGRVAPRGDAAVSLDFVSTILSVNKVATPGMVRTEGAARAADTSTADRSAPGGDVRVSLDAAPAADGTSGIPRKALLVGRASIALGDITFKKRLEKLGYQVTMVLDTDPASAGAFAVILISESSESIDIGSKYTANASPVVTSENRLFPRLDMSGSPVRDEHKTPNQKTITILDSSHPLAAGLRGKIDVYAKGSVMDFAIQLAPAAIKIASMDPSVSGGTSSYTIFAYEKGAALASGKPAPARRVGWYAEDEFVDQLTADSWKIFDACIEWAAGRL